MEIEYLATVVIPCFNADAYLEETIQSVVTQTGVAFQVLAINDGSTDNTRDVLNNFAKKYSNFRVLHTENQGEVQAFFHGIRSSNTKYIIRQDADDIMIRDRIRKQIYWMENNPGISVAGAWMYKFSRISNCGGLIKSPATSDFIEFIINFYNPILNPTTIIRRDCLDELMVPSFKIGSDLALWLCLISKGFRFSIMDVPVVKYRIHPAQATASDKNALITKFTEEVYCWARSEFSNLSKLNIGVKWRGGQLKANELTLVIKRSNCKNFFTDNKKENSLILIALLRLYIRCCDSYFKRFSEFISLLYFCGLMTQLPVFLIEILLLKKRVIIDD